MPSQRINQERKGDIEMELIERNSDAKKRAGAPFFSSRRERWQILVAATLCCVAISLGGGRKDLVPAWIFLLIVWGVRLNAVGCALCLVAGVWGVIVHKRDTRERAEAVDLIYLSLVMSPLPVAFGIYTYADEVLPFLARVLGLYGMRGVIFGVVVGFGFCAHLWKRKNQYTYGMGEVIFACMATAFIAFRIIPGQSVLSQWVALGGAAYVVARGMNNIVEAKKVMLSTIAAANTR